MSLRLSDDTNGELLAMLTTLAVKQGYTIADSTMNSVLLERGY